MDEQTPEQQPEDKSLRRGKGERIPKALRVTAKVLKQQGHTYKEIQDELKMSKKSVERALHDTSVDPDMVAKINRTLNQRVSSKLSETIIKIAEHLDNPEAIAKLGLYHSALILAILVDKKRLIDGESTANVAVHDLGQQVQEKLNEYAVMKQKLLDRISNG